jgi:uncharacterized protein (DUF4213/DUF364 family)
MNENQLDKIVKENLNILSEIGERDVTIVLPDTFVMISEAPLEVKIALRIERSIRNGHTSGLEILRIALGEDYRIAKK